MAIRKFLKIFMFLSNIYYKKDKTKLYKIKWRRKNMTKKILIPRFLTNKDTIKELYREADDSFIYYFSIDDNQMLAVEQNHQDCPPFAIYVVERQEFEEEIKLKVEEGFQIKKSMGKEITYDENGIRIELCTDEEGNIVNSEEDDEN
jgi:protease II